MIEKLRIGKDKQRKIWNKRSVFGFHSINHKKIEEPRKFYYYQTEEKIIWVFFFFSSFFGFFVSNESFRCVFMNSNWVFEFHCPLFCFRFWVSQICIFLLALCILYQRNLESYIRMTHKLQTSKKWRTRPAKKLKNPNRK